MIDASIVILTKNGQRYIGEILEKITSQDTEYLYEVIIIDSGSSDNTIKIAKNYQIRLHQIDASQFDHGQTRNLGAKLARGNYVVYLTQDATPANSMWLNNLLTPLEKDNTIAGTYSRHLPRKSCNPILARQIMDIWPTGSKKPLLKTKEKLLANKHEPQKIIHFSDSSSAIRKRVLKKLPFPKTMFAEDVQWEIKVLNAGFKTFYTPKSIILHSHDCTLLDQIRQNYDHAKAMLIIFPQVYRKTRKKVFFPMDFLQMLRMDAHYIVRRTRYNTLRKIYWLAYAPLWHLATYLGMRLAIMDVIIPFTIRRHISKQESLKQK